MHQYKSNPLEKFFDFEDEGPVMFETMINLSGQKILQFESGVRTAFEDADDNSLCN